MPTYDSNTSNGDVDLDALAEDFDAAQVAPDFAEAIPGGSYQAVSQKGKLFRSRNGTPGYRVQLKISEGEYQGHVLFCEIWLSHAALPMAKRDLERFGITDVRDLNKPFPHYSCRLHVSQRETDDGRKFNNIVSCRPLSPVEMPEDVFAPDDESESEPAVARDKDVPF